MKGKLIALYGINNLGKSTQAKLIVQELNNQGIPAEYLKYALYELEPSGPIINNYLRSGNPWNLTSREFQIMQVLNRTQYQIVLQKKLESGITIIAEDYVGTGIAWGMGSDIDFSFLESLNSHLLKPDISFLFYGKRFSEGLEAGHKHETDDVLTQKVAEIHNELGKQYGWEKIHANQPIKFITHELMSKIKMAKNKPFEYWK